MDIETIKSSIEHNELGKLYKYTAKIDDVNTCTEAFNSLSVGVESFGVPSQDTGHDPSMIMHARYSSGKCKGYEDTMGYMDCMINNTQYLNTIAGLCIFRGSQENSTRLFITDRNDLANPIFQNRFCYLLGCLCDKKLDIYVGNSIYGSSPLCNLGCLFDALECSTADLTMHACGRCGMCESLLWLHARNKCITQYGSLYFSGVGRILESYPMWREYYERCFVKAKNFGLITDQDVVDLMTTNNLIYISATDTLAALQK